jgi:hypothetical protein
MILAFNLNSAMKRLVLGETPSEGDPFLADQSHGTCAQACPEPYH